MGQRTIEVLDQISAKLDGASDYEIASRLGVTRATVSKWRTGAGSMSDEVAMRAAEFVDQQARDALLLEMAAERATSPIAAAAYRRIARHLRNATAAALTIAAIHAAATSQVLDSLYIM